MKDWPSMQRHWIFPRCPTLNPTAFSLPTWKEHQPCCSAFASRRYIGQSGHLLVSRCHRCITRGDSLRALSSLWVRLGFSWNASSNTLFQDAVPRPLLSPMCQGSVRLFPSVVPDTCREGPRCLQHKFPTFTERGSNSSHQAA
jgi:hypothetical protein